MLDGKTDKLFGGQKEDYLDHICKLDLAAQIMIFKALRHVLPIMNELLKKYWFIPER